jgi:hypothetical protein
METIDTKTYPSQEVQNVKIPKKVTSLINQKTPSFSSDTVSPKCLHGCQFFVYQVLKNANSLQKFKYFSEIFCFSRIK